MVTAELAAAMPAVAALAVLVLGVVGVGIDQIRCVDAARNAVRAMARGDPASAAEAAARSVSPAGASVTLGGDTRSVSATVRLVHSLPGGWGSFDLGATSRADRELAVP